MQATQPTSDDGANMEQIAEKDFELYKDCILSGQISEKEISALFAANPLCVPKTLSELMT